MKQITVTTPSRTCAVRVARGGMAHLGAALAALGGGRVMVLSSPRVWRHHGRTIHSGLRGCAPRLVLFNDAERNKRLHTVEKIARQLAAAGADRQCIVAAVGGGVVGDVAGFVAASYLRGVRLVHVPTTLVAQVDSAIGGKTGVNLPEGKNLVGAFYQPDLVLTDPDALRTLPAREYRSGLYEVIKYGILGDATLFAFLERELPALLGQKAKPLDGVIARCVRMKARVVSRDEREAGLREVLNLGHTFAHALETATAYRRYLHGEAVGLGLRAAAHLATRMKMLPPQDAQRIATLVARVGKIPPWPACSEAKLLQIMKGDKKARGGNLRLVLPRRIGQVRTGVEAPERLVRETLRAMRTRGRR